MKKARIAILALAVVSLCCGIGILMGRNLSYGIKGQTKRIDKISPTLTFAPTPIKPSTTTPMPTHTLSPTLTPTPLPKTGIVTTRFNEGNLNLREGPGIKFRIITILPEGDPVIILSEKNNWMLVKWEHLTGWVYSNYIVER